MGRLGKQDDPAEPGPARPAAVEGIDFERYELGSVGDDVRAILDVPGAVAQAAKYALGLPLIVAVVAWIGFSGRLSNWLLVPFVAGVFALSFFSSVLIGALIVTRKRLALVEDATKRLVAVTGEMHADIVQLRDGQADTSVQHVAVGLLEHAIFPMVFGTLTGTAQSGMGPLGFLGARVVKVPLALVERSTVAAIEALPDRRVGELLDSTASALPGIGQAATSLSAEYQSIRDRVEDIVAKVSRTAVASVIGLAVLATIPLLIWVAIGVVAT